MIPFGVIAGIVASNFIYQAVFHDAPNWSAAFEHSYYQLVAIAIFATFDRLTSNRGKQS